MPILLIFMFIFKRNFKFRFNEDCSSNRIRWKITNHENKYTIDSQNPKGYFKENHRDNEISNTYPFILRDIRK